MKQIELINKTSFETNERFSYTFNQFKQILDELKERELNDEVISSINKEIELINTLKGSEKEVRKHIQKAQSNILQFIEKKLKLVPKNHYRNLWMVLGMAAFGIPLGAAFGTIQGNMAMLGIGLPIGMALGLAIGSRMDKKALKEHRQLKLEVRF